MRNSIARQNNQHLVLNGNMFLHGLGCEYAPSCFACEESRCIRRGKWQGEYPTCLKPEKCLECKQKHCLEKARVSLPRQREMKIAYAVEIKRKSPALSQQKINLLVTDKYGSGLHHVTLRRAIWMVEDGG